MKKYNHIDIARCIANYVIILLHSEAACQYCNSDSFEYGLWQYITECLCPCALPALFMISGYLLFRNYSLASYGEKIGRRIRRLVVPYISWNILFVLFYLICGHFVPRLSDRVDSFKLCTVGGAIDKVVSLTTHPIDGPLWFLRTLFLFSFISPLLFLFLNSKKGRVIGGLLMVGLYISATVFDLFPFLKLTYPLYALTIFCVGGSLALSNDEDGSFVWFKSKWWVLPSFIGITLMTYIHYCGDIIPGTYNNLLWDLSLLLYTPILFIIVNMINVDKLISNSFFAYMKGMSFFAYAGHFLFCSILLHTVAPLLNFMSTGKFTVLVLIFCIGGTSIMAGIYYLGKKYLPHVMKLYDGSL